MYNGAAQMFCVLIALWKHIMLLFTGIFYFISNYKTLKAGFMGEQAILVLVLIMSSRIGFVTPGRKIIVDS